MKTLKRLLPALFALALTLSLVFVAACKPDPQTNEYTVTFDSAGGSTVESQTVEEGELVTKPADPTYSEHEFIGWYLNDAAYDFNTPVTEDITLTAKWTPGVYTVTFDSAGGSEIANVTVEEGNKVARPANPTYEDNEFLGWFIGETEYNFDAPVTGNITLTAKWTIYHTVKFEASDSAFVEYKVKDGETVIRPGDPAFAGHEFDGWFVGEKEFDFKTPITEDMTITAKWTAIYTVTYDSNGGTEVESETVRNGELFTEPVDPDFGENIFLGWFLNGKIYDFSTPATENIKLTAKWLKDMLVDISINVTNVKKSYAIGEKFSSENIVITATLKDKLTHEEFKDEIAINDKHVIIDSSAFNNTEAGTYVIYVGYELSGITRWANYEVKVTGGISGVHGIEISKEKVEYEVAIDEAPVAIDIDDIKVNAVNANGTLGAEIKEGVTYKYFQGNKEIKPEDITNEKVGDYQIWAYVDYKQGNEVYTMSDFVIVTIIGDEIYEMSLKSGKTTQEQSYEDLMSGKWVINASFTLTGDKTIDLSKLEIGTEAGRYTVSGISPAVVGGGKAVVTYYYLVGTEVMSAKLEVPYSVGFATKSFEFGAIIDVNVGSADQAELPAATHEIKAVANGDEIVPFMVYSNGMSGTNGENKGGANGEGKLYGRVQFGTTKGFTLNLAGPATIKLYARWGSSSGDGAAFVLNAADGTKVDESEIVSNGSLYQIVTVEAPKAGVYTLFSSTGSLNTFRIEIAGKVIPVQAMANANDYAVNDNVVTEMPVGDTFTLIGVSGAAIKIKDMSAEPAIIGGMQFTRGFDLGGSKKGSGNGRSIKFTVTEKMLENGPVYLTAYANHGGGADVARTLGIYADGQSGNKYVEGLGATVVGAGSVCDYTITKAGTYYMGSANSGIVVTQLILSYVAAEEV